MKFNHLPESGGMNGQDPMLFHYWDILWDEEAKESKREQDKRERESKSSRGSKGRVAGR